MQRDYSEWVRNGHFTDSIEQVPGIKDASLLKRHGFTMALHLLGMFIEFYGDEATFVAWIKENGGSEVTAVAIKEKATIALAL